jgi:gluconokinase
MTPYKSVSNPSASTNLIIVMGVSGSGKSTLAKTLADIYDYEFLDADDFHSDASRALMAQAIPLTDDQRTPWVAAIKHHLETNAKQHIHAVLAFSGLKQKHRDELRAAGLRTLVLYLNGSKATIQDRITNRQGHFMAPALLDSQFAAMEDPLNEIDVHLIDVWPTIEQVVTQARDVVDTYLIPQTK